MTKLKKFMMKTLCFIAVLSAAVFSVSCEKQQPGDDSPSPGPSAEIPADGPSEETEMLALTAPSGEVFPYIASARLYLNAPFGADVASYYMGYENPGREVEISWECTYEGVTGFTVEYATQEDYSDAITLSASAERRSIGIDNLYKGTRYYVRIAAETESGDCYTDESSFFTTDLGPRVMTVSGLYNVRDVGGYTTDSGKKTLQGLVYRGSEMNGTHGIALDEEGDRYMSEVMKIAHDMDFRSPADADYAAESPISSASLAYYSIDGYASAFSESYREAYRRIFSALADERNYPVYMHCWGGADRTGTVAYILNALLGVSEEDLIHDFEFTTFSVFGVRTSKGSDFLSFQSKFNAFGGDTLAEKAESYLISIGVTETEIYNIRAIMFGENTKAFVSAQESFTEYFDTELSITVSGGKTVGQVYVGGESVSFSESASGVTVAAEDMPRGLADGKTAGRLVFTDETEETFSFEYRSFSAVETDGYLPFGDGGEILLNGEKTSVQGENAIGYGTRVCMRMKSVTAQNGGIYVMIGSYGVYFRGGEFRPAVMEEGGTYKEYTRNAGMYYTLDAFDGDDILLFLLADVSEDGAKLNVIVYENGVKTEYDYTYEQRIENEIAAEEAKLTVAIVYPDVASLVIRSGVSES